MTTTAKYTLSSAQHIIYDLGCVTCDAPRYLPCTVVGTRLRRSWHAERITSAERHFHYGHEHSNYCSCGI